MKKDKKLTTLVVTLAIAVALSMGVCLIGCDPADDPTPPAAKEYTISFVGGGNDVTGTAPEALKKKEGDKITLPENMFSYAGHKFVGWSYAEQSYAVGDEFEVKTSDVTFTAQWVDLYTVSYVGGDGATGTAPASQTDLDAGTEITLAENNSLTKGEYDFLGWKCGDSIYDAGETVTVNSSMVFTAVWGFTYLNNSDSNVTEAKVIPDEELLRLRCVVYGGKVIYTDYKYTVNDDVYTFTNVGGTDTYTGYYVNDVIVALLPANTGYFTSNQTLILSLEKLSVLDDFVVNDYAQTENFEDPDYLYLFKNKLAVFIDGGYFPTEIKAGTYSKSNNICTVNYSNGSVQYKLENMSGVIFFSTRDSFFGEYTLNETNYTLDGFGGWTLGDYIAFSNDAEKLIYLNNPDTPATYVCEVSSDNVLTPLSDVTYKPYGGGGVFSTIYYNGKTLIGAVAANSGVSATLVNNKTALVFQENIAEVTYDSEHNQFVVVVEEYDYNDKLTIITKYYTLNGQAPYIADAIEIEDGSYVNNIDSSVSATISTVDGAQTMTLTNGTTSAVFTVMSTATDVTFTHKEKGNEYKGAVINGVIVVQNIQLNPSDYKTAYLVVLSKTALSKIDVTAAAGYYAMQNSTSNKLYVYTNGLAVMNTSSSYGRVGTYTVTDNVYDISFTYNATSAATQKLVCKLVADAGDVAAYYIEKDKVAGTYSVGSDTIVIDGFGNFTKGSVNGTYKSGATGFTLLTSEGEIDKCYAIGADNALEEVTETVEGAYNYAGGNSRTELAKANIVFDSTFSIYGETGCAEVGYTYNETHATVRVVVGTTFTVGDVTFTVTKLTDQLNITYTGTYTDAEGATTALKSWNVLYGIAG